MDNLNDDANKITQFLDQYEDHFSILICESFKNRRHILKQQAVFKASPKEIIRQFIQEHSQLVAQNYLKDFNTLPKKQRPTNIRFTTICDGCKGYVVYNTVSCGEGCPLLTMPGRILSYKLS